MKSESGTKIWELYIGFFMIYIAVGNIDRISLPVAFGTGEQG